MRDSIDNPDKPLDYERDIFYKASDIIQEDGISPQERRIMFEETGTESHMKLQFEEGRRTQAIETAQRFHEMGLKIETIAQGTGLSVHELEALLRKARDK